MLTSDRGFADRGRIVADQVVVVHIVDRLLHNTTVVDVRRHTYRTPKPCGRSQGKRRCRWYSSLIVWGATFRDRNWRLFVIT